MSKVSRGTTRVRYDARIFIHVEFVEGDSFLVLVETEIIFVFCFVVVGFSIEVVVV